MRTLRPDPERPAAPLVSGPGGWLPVLTRRAFLRCAGLLAGGIAALDLAGCAATADEAEKDGASFFDDGTGFAA